MIYIDALRAFPGKRKQYAHMVSDLSIAELHAFAARIGIKRHWFHRNHYDLREPEWYAAVRAGAHITTSKQVVRHLTTLASRSTIAV